MFCFSAQCSKIVFCLVGPQGAIPGVVLAPVVLQLQELMLWLTLQFKKNVCFSVYDDVFDM